MFVSDKI